MKTRILFLAANPTGTARLLLDEEIRAILQKIRASEHRDDFEVVQAWAVRPDDLQQTMLEHKPHIVHFSGHGSPTDEIILLDESRNPKPVGADALAGLFKILSDNVEVVVLNACYSASQAEAITSHVPYAIGMSKAVGDQAAITFAAAFYRAIGFGRSVQEAFDLGRNALLLGGQSGADTPQLIARDSPRSRRPASIDYSRLSFKEKLKGTGNELFSVAFSSDGRFVAAGSNKEILLWDLSSQARTLRRLKGHRGYVYSVAFSPDNTCLVSSGEDATVRAWDVNTGAARWVVEKEHTEAVYTVAFSPCGRRLASGGYDGLVFIWNAATGRIERHQDRALAQIGRVTSLAFHKDGNLLAIGRLDDIVTLWDLSSGKVHHLEGHVSSVETVAFSHTGHLLASAGLDKTVRVWDVETKTQKWCKKEHEYLIRTVAFSLDDKTLASASWDKTVRLWDAENGGFVRLIPISAEERTKWWHTDWVWSVAFAPDGVVASCGSDGDLFLYTVGA